MMRTTRSLVVAVALTAGLLGFSAQAEEPVQILVENGYGTEGDLLPTFVEFEASLSRASTDEVGFSYSTSTLTNLTCMSLPGRSHCAYPLDDYVDVAGTVIFSPGETRKTFRVPIVPDDYSELDESFDVDLLAPVNGVFAPQNDPWVGGLLGTAFGTIIDDDRPGTTVELTAQGRKEKGKHVVDLSWTGAQTDSIDVIRNETWVATTENDGTYTDRTGNRGKASYTYRVCEAGTANCSNEANVDF